jgi:hypothetical protein
MKKTYGKPGAAMLINIFFGSLGNALYFLCLCKLGLRKIDGILFTSVLAVSLPHMLFSSIPETYAFTSTSLILLLFLFLFVTGRMSFLFWFLAGSLLSIGITITGIIFSMFLFFRRLHVKAEPGKAILSLLIFCIVLAFTFDGFIHIQEQLYPGTKRFFDRETISSNAAFLSDELLQHPVEAILRRVPHFFLYNVVAPGSVRNAVTFPGIRQSYPMTLLTMTIYLCLMSLCIYLMITMKVYRDGLFRTLLLFLCFSALFFLFYGTEPHLYQAHYTFAWVTLLAFPLTMRKQIPGKILHGFYVCMGLFLPMLALNNWIFLRAILDKL